LRDVYIGKTVAVVVADRDSHAISPTGDTCPLRNVGKRPVAIVAVKSIPQWSRGIIEIRFPTVDEVNVHPAIIVKIQERTAGSAGLRQMLVRGLAGSMDPGDSARRRRDLFERIVRLRNRGTVERSSLEL